MWKKNKTPRRGPARDLARGRGGKQYVPDTPSKTRSFRNASRQIGQVFVFWAHNLMHASWMMWSQLSKAAILAFESKFGASSSAVVVFNVVIRDSGSAGGSSPVWTLAVADRSEGAWITSGSRQMMHWSGSVIFRAPSAATGA